MATDSSYMIAPGETSEGLAMRRKLAMAMLQQGQDTDKIQHPTQGLAKMLQAAIGGYGVYSADQADREETAAGNALIAQMLGGGGATASPVSSPDAPRVPGNVVASLGGGGGDFGSAISSIESGGKYDALGPVTKSGDRAYGKYQVMGANIPEWSQAALGQKLTPEQFLADPKAQDAIFQNKFGSYASKYGPEGAARAWFAGEGGMNDLGRKDQLGTSVGSYGQKFAQALGQPTQVAQASPQAGVPNRELLIKMLGNRKTAPMAKQILGAQISQQFKPSEYDFKERPDGTLVAVDKKNPRNVHVVDAPGGGQDAIDHAAKLEAAKAAAKLKAERDVVAPEKAKQERQVADIVTQDIDRAIGIVDKAKMPTTGMTGSLMSNIGGTSANDLRALLDTVKANAGFQELNKMRSMSPTGGALGSITERELSLLQATIGNLEQSQSADQFKDNLRRVKNMYLDVIHGPGKGPDRARLTYQDQGAAPDRASIEAEMKRRGLLK